MPPSGCTGVMTLRAPTSQRVVEKFLGTTQPTCGAFTTESLERLLRSFREVRPGRGALKHPLIVQQIRSAIHHERLASHKLSDGLRVSARRPDGPVRDTTQ